MGKKISILLITFSLILTMFIPVMAANGDNVGEDIFNQPSVTMSLEEGTYKLGTIKDFKLSTYCGAYSGKEVVRKIQIEGKKYSGFKYFDGSGWSGATKYNNTVMLKNDIDRKFQVIFEEEGEYIITYSVTDTKGQLLTASRRYLTVTDKNISVQLPITPLSSVTYKVPTGNDSNYYFSWSQKSKAVKYDFYINGKKVKSVTTNNCDIPSSYFAKAGNYLIGVTAVDAMGHESVMKTIAYNVKGGTGLQTTTKNNKTEKQTTKKASKPGQVKSFRAKNIKGKKVKLTWKKQKGISGYQIVYATNKKIKKGKKTIKIKKASITKKTTGKLKKKKTYYFKIRAYKKVGKKTVYGSWSKVKPVKIKK